MREREIGYKERNRYPVQRPPQNGREMGGRGYNTRGEDQSTLRSIRLE